MRVACFTLTATGEVVTSFSWQDPTRRCPFLLPVQDGQEVICVDLDAAGLDEVPQGITTRAGLVAAVPAVHRVHSRVAVPAASSGEAILRGIDGALYRKRTNNVFERI